jgi:Fe2+ or Zn2+ uptake regulation protein
LILQVFEDAEHEGRKHLTIEQIGERLQASGYSINRSTIYRNIDWMLAASILQVNRLLGEGTTYELAAPPDVGDSHVHLVCRRCLNVQHGEISKGEVQHGEISKSEASPVGSPHFHQIASTVTITGYCATCWQELAEKS